MSKRRSQGSSAWKAASWALVLCCSLATGCREADPRPQPEARAMERPSAAGEMSPAVQPDLCALRIRELEGAEKLVGAPGLEQHRAEVLARARAVPLLFRERPGPPEPLTERVAQFRAELLKEVDPTHAILDVLRKTRGNYEERRAVFLSDRYLYAEQPVLALRLSQVLRLDHLFSKQEPELVIGRGAETLTVSRREGRYWLPPAADARPGEQHNERLASLLLFDRVRAVEESFDPPLHVDLRALQRTLGFSRARIDAITADGIVVSLWTYGAPSRAVFSVRAGEAFLECETAGAEPLEALRAARSAWHLDQDLIDPVLSAAHEMIARRLPFDEPKTEEGQQDGLLRIHYRKAYRSYQNTYEFNGDKYYVFDGYGRPRLPQVCIDFITDAFDWGTGGHWPRRGEKREQVKGAIHFGSMGMENPRSVENLAEYAAATPEWFDVLAIEKKDQVKFRHRTEFFKKLESEVELYRRGDIVFIFGLKDDGKFHYHSFMIDEKDPVTGMPMVVLANAGPPQARTWEGEMQNAPLRAIVSRVRVRREILQEARTQAKIQPGVPLVPPRYEDDEEVPPLAAKPKRSLPEGERDGPAPVVVAPGGTGGLPRATRGARPKARPSVALPGAPRKAPTGATPSPAAERDPRARGPNQE